MFQYKAKRAKARRGPMNVTVFVSDFHAERMDAVFQWVFGLEPSLLQGQTTVTVSHSGRRRRVRGHRWVFPHVSFRFRFGFGSLPVWLSLVLLDSIRVGWVSVWFSSVGFSSAWFSSVEALGSALFRLVSLPLLSSRSVSSFISVLSWLWLELVPALRSVLRVAHDWK